MVKKITVIFAITMIMLIVPLSSVSAADKIMGTITLSNSILTLNEGDSGYTVKVAVNSIGMTINDILKDISVKSNNTKYVTVSALKAKNEESFYFTVYPVKAGNAAIEVTSKNDPGCNQTCSVQIAKADSGVSKDELTKLGTQTDNSLIDNVLGSMIEFIEWSSGMKIIQKDIQADGSDLIYFTTDTQADIVKTLNAIFLPTAYMVMLIVWAVNMAKKSIAFDLYEAKGILKSCVRLFVGLICISMSVAIFSLLRSIELGMISRLFSYSDYDVWTNSITVTDLQSCYDNTWVIGKLITLLRVLGKLPKALIIAIINSLVYAILEIIIVFRVVKICIYQGAAPIFIGMVSSEETVPIARNYIMQYIRLLAQGVVMAIIFYIYEKIYFSNPVTEIRATNFETMNITDFMFYAVVCILLPFMILSSEKLVNKMIGRG